MPAVCGSCRSSIEPADATAERDSWTEAIMAAMGGTGDAPKPSTGPGLPAAQLSALTAILRNLMKETTGLGTVRHWHLSWQSLVVWVDAKRRPVQDTNITCSSPVVLLLFFR